MRLIQFAVYFIIRLPFYAFYKFLDVMTIPLFWSRRFNVALLCAVLTLFVPSLVVQGVIPAKAFYLSGYNVNPLWWLAYGCCRTPEMMIVTAVGFLVLARTGDFFIRVLFGDISPYANLREKYQAVLQKTDKAKQNPQTINKVIVVPKSPEQDEDITSITNRLPPHLQELISKK